MEQGRGRRGGIPGQAETDGGQWGRAEPPHLSARMLLVLQLREVGYTRAEIARLLTATVEDVADTERAACAALGARTTADAVARALARGLIIGAPAAARRRPPTSL